MPPNDQQTAEDADDLKGTVWEPIVDDLLGLSSRVVRLETFLDDYDRRHPVKS